jgi:NADH dehydrogenase
MAEVKKINSERNEIETGIGNLNYDYLVMAIGADTNFFGLENIKKYALPMKSVAEALFIRNTILQNFEKLLDANDEERDELLNIVIVGGGPTGVEVAGSLSEMRSHILPKDYPDLDYDKMKIYLLEASEKLLNVMSEKSSEKSKIFLEKLGVKVMLNTKVNDYDGTFVHLGNGEKIKTKILIWAAGVSGNKIEGLKADVFVRGNRIKVDQYCKVEGYENIFAIGDIACMTEEKYPSGHPQLAQPAMQQADLLATNFKRKLHSLIIQPFTYKDLGSMATIGRNLAVVDLPFISFQGFFAWLIWMFIHLMAILGVKNKLFIFIDWCWSYFSYDSSLRLIIKPKYPN